MSTTLTEAEAAGCFCPHQRVTWANPRNDEGGWSTAGHPAFGLVAFTTDNSKRRAVAWCLGSQCMAWRWSERPTTARARRGYCGLSGQP